MSKTIPQAPSPAARFPAPCPTWCTGRHAHHGDGPENDRYHHLAAGCPPWCSGHAGGQDPAIEAEHAGPLLELRLSLAEPYEPAVGELVPDYVAVSMWQDSRYPAGTVSLMHGAEDHYVPDMTPQEAVALAAALVQAAYRIQPAAVESIAGPTVPLHGAGVCPPWCAGDSHEANRQLAGDDIHLSAAVGVPVASARHHCCYSDAPAPFAVEECAVDVTAELVLADDGESQVELYHGDDMLPALTLPAAEALAWKILGLACAAREPVES